MTDTETSQAATLPAPTIERLRHELRRRELTVTAKEYLTPQMIRITLTSDDLDTFVSGAFDDHVKIFFPDEGAEKVMRDYTPRRYDTDGRSLVLDFAVHDAGPATAWAVGAAVGDRLNIGGPRGSRRITGQISQWVLIGDETALPAMGRFAEEAEAGARVSMFAAVRDAAEEQAFDSAADLRMTWVHRPESQAADARALLEAVKDAPFGEGTFIWIAAEASVTQAVRAWFIEAGHPLVWTKSAGYWVAGEPDKTVSFD
ncbi:siderophore-interacting protein [Pseudooceanicola sediminis]|uniref:Siderophore-interacting protein n=1 Tax=Pseudooceanicola sediminis TaxID=2211117 RepID=A0A399J8B7_9RHOB|nr:siderophore-interacting protein [Pseudooceanicola sediminis]KAA2315524.1 siderophore-interacting protein [Puniceibacterium sp. HSS470]RII40272.1 siderophore-interacting protein [Pseudooceanicola sediminis]|tara:strand:- start:71933 stop:72706 length:774 start_codon:yes stop_codon:yes gene_type:complete